MTKKTMTDEELVKQMNTEIVRWLYSEERDDWWSYQHNFEAAKLRIEALTAENEALTAENERLRLFIAYTAECCEDAHIVAKAFEALEKKP